MPRPGLVIGPVLALLIGLSVLSPVAHSAGDPSVRSVFPAEGARGTVLTIAGSGFGKKKPRVVLMPEAGTKPRRLKVLEWSDGEIKARIRKAPAGMHALVVRPRAKGAGEAALLAAFELRPPSELVTGAVCVRASDEVSVSGSYFGSKKGKVFVDGRKAKVLSWAAGEQEGGGPAIDEIVFRVPPKNVVGTVGVEVRNAVGGTLLADAMLVLDSTDLLFTATFGEDVFAGDLTDSSSFVEVVGGQTHVFVADGVGDSVDFRVLYDPALDGPKTFDGLDILQFTWQHDGTLWVLDVDDAFKSSVTLQIDPHCEGALLGTFSGFLRMRFGGGTVDVTNGEFQVPLGRSSG